MFILFGTRSAYVKKIEINEPCKHCGNKSFELVIDQRFAHIFWIPMFPIRKQYSAQCYHCKTSMTESEIKSFHPGTYSEAVKKTGTPFWSYSGSAFIFFCILLIVALGYIRSMKHQYMIQMPERGDLYKYRSASGAYSLLKVSDVRHDTVLVLPNKYAVEGVISMRKLIEESEFDFETEPIPVLRSDLIQMFETGDIINIVRE